MSTTVGPWDAARKGHYDRLRAEPFHHASYHALFGLYEEAGWTDAAFCVASALAFLRKATPAQLAFVEELRRPDLPRARQPLCEDTLRQHVAHPDQDLTLTCILGSIAPAVAVWRSVEPPAPLRPQDRSRVWTYPTPLTRSLEYVQWVLGVLPPDVFVRPQDQGDLCLMNTQRDEHLHPTIVVFQNLSTRTDARELAFALGRYLFDLYPPHFCFVALDRSPAALRQVVMACLHGLGMPGLHDPKALAQIAHEVLGRMTTTAREPLRDLVGRLIAKGEAIDVRRWVAATELTGYRVGLLLAGDLRIAAKMILLEQAPLGVAAAISLRDKLQDLVLYSISDDYFAARHSLGVDVRRPRWRAIAPPRAKFCG